MFNRLIFPAPTPSYGIGKLQGELVHIPRNVAQPPKIVRTQQEQQQSEAEAASSTSTTPSPLLSVRLSPAYYDFTCGLFIRGNQNAKHIVMYCHPNAVDIGHMRSEFVHMVRHCNVHCFLVEFQGYGLLQSSSPSEQQATEDGFAGYNFITKTMGFPANKLIMMGRSIGTGVTCQVAAQLQEPEQVPLAVCLQCPFTSIKACVKSLAGKNFGDFASEMVGERFLSIKNITKIKCPVAIIHGINDTIVPFQHGVDLTRAAVEAGKEDTVLIQLNCDHNDIPLEPGFAWIRETIEKDTNANDGKAPSTTEVVDRIRPFFAGPPAYQDMQEGRSRPMPLTKVPSSTLPGSSAISRQASNIITSPYSHLSQTLSYNVFSFLSLVRTAWEMYIMCREEAVSQASSSEQVMQYVNMLAPSLVANAVSSLRDKSTQLADQWKMSDFVELCACLWGHPFGIGLLEAQGGGKKKNSNSNRFVFGSSSPDPLSGSGEHCVFYSGSNGDHPPTQTSISHYDEIWGRVSSTLRLTYKEIHEYASKIRKEQEEYEKEMRQKILEKQQKGESPVVSPATENEPLTKESTNQEKTEEEKPSSTMTSSSSPSNQPQWDHVPGQTQQQQEITATNFPPFKSSLPPFNTAAVVSQNSLRSEDFIPKIFCSFPPTILKIFSDNLEKSKRSAPETMRRIEEYMNSPQVSGDASITVPMKPQPVTEKGAQWVQIEMERFVISNLVLGQNQKSTSTSSSTTESLEMIDKEFSCEGGGDSSVEVQNWKKELSTLLHGPFLDGVLLPLPISLDSDEAMKELLKLYRRAPSSVCVQPAEIDNALSIRGGGGGAGGGGSGKKSADCVIQ